jgi:hypothetical protein
MSIDEPRQLDDEQIEEVAGGLAWRSNNRHVLSRSQPKRKLTCGFVRSGC